MTKKRQIARKANHSEVCFITDKVPFSWNHHTMIQIMILSLEKVKNTDYSQNA